jgi:hypothetical protein
MIKFDVGAVAVTAFVALSLAGTDVPAAEPASRNARDLAEFTCKEIMRLSGQDRDVALAMAHGYVLGKKGTTKYEIDKLSDITDRFIDYCLDHPTDNALAAFERTAK